MRLNGSFFLVWIFENVLNERSVAADVAGTLNILFAMTHK